MKKKMQRIQMLRGFLFILILAFHSFMPYSSAFWMGIEGFFLLSAFFLTKKSLSKDSISIKEQFVHRIKRLYLPYILVLFIAVLFAFVTRSIPYDFIPLLLSGQSFLWMFTGYSSPMQLMTAHTWTLSIDVWAGLLWVIMLKYFSKRTFKKVMYISLVASVCIRTILIMGACDTLVLTLSPLTHIDAFALGSLLAIQITDSVNNKPLKAHVAAGVIGILGVVLSLLYLMWNYDATLMTAYCMLEDKKYYLTNPVSGNIFLYISLLFYWVIFCLHKKDSMDADVRRGGTHRLARLFAYIGDRSYVLYLFHWPIVVVLRYLWNHWLFVLVAGGIASLIATIIFEKWIEPFVKKLGGKKI